MTTPPLKPDPLTETQVGRIADAVVKRTRTSRATQMMGAVADAPAKSPLIYWPLAIAIMAFGFWRMEQHPHPVKDYVHLGSDWAVIALGVAFLPGAAAKVGALLKTVAPYIPLFRKPNGGTS